MMKTTQHPHYRATFAASLLAAREAVMGPIRPILGAIGLTEQQWRVLRVLVDEGEADPSLIARSGLLYAPTVTRILKELAERRLIVREGDPLDGRRSIIYATPRGRMLVDQTAPKTLEVIENCAGRFGPVRLKALHLELDALVQCLAAEEPAPENLPADITKTLR